MSKDRIVWLTTWVLLGVHLVAGLGYYNTQSEPAGWVKNELGLPSNGFIDQDAHHRPNAWVLSHHDAWQAEQAQQLDVKARLLEGAQLTIGEGSDEIFIRCDFATLVLGHRHATANCDSFRSERTDCFMEAKFERSPSAIHWAINGNKGKCAFRQSGVNTTEPVRWRVGSKVRPVLINKINSNQPLDIFETIGTLIFTTLFMVGFARFARVQTLFFAALFTIWMPILSPEVVAVVFRAPQWNHWALSLYSLSMITIFSHVGRKQLRKPRLGAVLFFLLALGFALLGGSFSFLSVTGFSLAGLSFWLLIQSMRKKSGLLSAVGILLFLVFLEFGSRNSLTGQLWLRDLGYANATIEALSGAGQEHLRQISQEHEIFSASQFQEYPSTAFPVSYPEKKHRSRIVMMGGSSTGGAYQMDDLSTFYPARLESLLNNEFEVVNQGVGGWTTFHIRRYLSTHLAKLNPDILTLYVSNNDASKKLPADIEAVYARLDAGNLEPPSISLLGPLSLAHRLVWLSELVEAVPPAKMEKNIIHVVSMIPESKRRILLLPELNSHNQKRLGVYHRGLERIAENYSGVEIWNGTEILPQNRSELFLDQVHLSESGHQWLAENISTRLEQLGWLRQP